MYRALHWTRCVVPAASAALTVFSPSDGWTADLAVLPWDYTFNAIQNFVGGPLSHLVIVIAASCCAQLYAGRRQSGDNAVVRRLAKTAIGTRAALLAVQLLNYLAP